MRLRGALDTHAGQRADRFQSKRHALAVDDIGFVDQVGQEAGQSSCVLEPLDRGIHQLVRGGFGIGVIADAGLLMFLRSVHGVLSLGVTAATSSRCGTPSTARRAADLRIRGCIGCPCPDAGRWD